MNFETKQTKKINHYMKKKHWLLNWVHILVLLTSMAAIFWGIYNNVDAGKLTFFSVMGTSAFVRLSKESEWLGKNMSRIILDKNDIEIDKEESDHEK